MLSSGFKLTDKHSKSKLFWSRSVADGCHYHSCILVSRWELVVEKMKSTLSSWRAKVMSFDDRLTLRKWVLGRLMVYSFSLFCPLRCVISEIKRMMVFLLGVYGSNHGNPLARVVRYFKNGGLNVGSLKVSNWGLLEKWRWRVLCVKYALRGDMGWIFDASDAKLVWSGILKVGRDMQRLRISLSSSFGNLLTGERIDYGQDRWLMKELLANRFNALWQLQRNKEEGAGGGRVEMEMGLENGSSGIERVEFDNLICFITRMEGKCKWRW
ncbi:LOW QUALITY PROTEIN: hypothetical protein OSB04_006822 [Centaurea solstitialis]|uniref:Uncharacterized protein n=1 Tax=Centaurea solstitialis TaxID=347529 RepID=A0AA38WI12_9ASTR|nr:LOW QUALITY PROTEIN: hypothetical protein OSB04_006821 [Centaurea solstitialis]KAJ9561662.1 LOW QUALITY PROTEIN: hypothetical protein OSB04_006822 [Centaurea solstitialis]